MANTRTKWTGGVVLSLLCCFCLSASLWAATINVPWDHATIQGAVDAAIDGDEIVVAAGTYVEQVVVANKNITVRSSNPLDPAVVAATIIDGDAVSSVVRVDNADSVVSGFTLTNGIGWESNSWPFKAGGGVFAEDSTFTVSYCNITGNTATLGGGVAADTCNPTLIHNVISGNSASGFDGHGGGGVLIYSASSGTINNNLIADNTAAGKGGGIEFWACGTFVTNNTIAGNESTADGGGVACVAAYPVIKNTIIAGNPVGGGVFVTESNPGGVSSKMSKKPSGPSFVYCNVFGNVSYDFSGISDPTGFNGNISVDPLFADATNGDYRLKSVAGRWNGTSWVKDTDESPCLDAGDPASDFSQEPRTNGGRINMGFDGNTNRASKTAQPKVLFYSPKGPAVRPGREVVLIFNKPMNRGSVERNFFFSSTNTMEIVAGTFTWKNRRMTFTPTNPLTYGASYDVYVARAARDLKDRRMSEACDFRFTVRNAPAPAPLLAAAVPTALGAQISLSLSEASDVTVTVTNLAGRSVAVLQSGRLDEGPQTVLWNGRATTGSKVPAGTYLVTVAARSPQGTETRAVTTLRMGTK